MILVDQRSQPPSLSGRELGLPDVLDSLVRARATFGPRELFDEGFIWLLRGSAGWTVQSGTLWIAEGMRIVSVEELASLVTISSGHVFRLFRQHYGVGPARALELVRLVRAATWLQRSNSTLAEIAARAGFANAYHFSRRFSAAYGSAPGAFRRRGATADPYEILRSPELVSLAQMLLQAPTQPAPRRAGQLVG